MDLKKLIDEEINELEYICRIRTYHELDKQIFSATKKGADDFEYLIMLPVLYNDGEMLRKVKDLYGKPI